MRYIDIRPLEEREAWPPDSWKKLARRAENELRNLPPDEPRVSVFKNYSNVWGSLKDDFRLLSYDKCWYCETSTRNMRGDMDHYRPKGGVTGTKHPGYWWLAFNWRNFRFSCERCNSGIPDPESEVKGGKGNHFPLVGGEGKRIWDACWNYEDHRKEDPMLLDPTSPYDPNLITFTSDGRPRPAVKDKTSIDFLRAENSIRIYQLNHSRLNRKRRVDIYLRIRELVERIQYRKLEREGDRDNEAVQAIIENDLEELRRMLAPQAEYSSAANAYLRRYRRWAWVDRLSSGSK